MTHYRLSSRRSFAPRDLGVGDGSPPRDPSRRSRVGMTVAAYRNRTNSHGMCIRPAHRPSILKQQRREAVNAAAPGPPLVGRAFRFVIDVLDALRFEGAVERP